MAVEKRCYAHPARGIRAMNAIHAAAQVLGDVILGAIMEKSTAMGAVGGDVSMRR